MPTLTNGSTSSALPILAIVSAIVALVGLLPLAGGLPAIASPALFSADAIWFTVNLAGPLLLLAAGVRLLLPGPSQLVYVSIYIAVLIAIGELRLWLAGFPRLTIGWLMMSVCVGLLLLILQRFWVWALVGGIWSGLLLGFWSYGGIVSYMSASAPQFPMLLPVQIIGCLLTLLVAGLYLRVR
jgi:hypothetical protein